MPGIVVRQSMAQYSAWAQKLGSNFAAALQRGTVSGAARALTVMQRRTREAPPANPAGKGTGGAVNTGGAGYLGSWRSTALAPIGAVVFNFKPYAAIIELGRRIGKPPPREIIMHWAQRRLGLSKKEAEKAAWPIAMAIAKRGLLPRYVMARGVGEMNAVVHEEQVRELDAALSEKGA